jgi:hypothetical protein
MKCTNCNSKIAGKAGRPITPQGKFARKSNTERPDILHTMRRVQRAGGIEKLEKLSPEVQRLLMGVSS